MCELRSKIIGVIVFLVMMFAVYADDVGLQSQATKVITVSSAGSGTVYYVDNVLGSDANNGRTVSTAWASITKVRGSMGAFVGGDSIRFKRGCTWTGIALNITCSGSLGNLITFADYGTGAKPVIDVDNTGGLGPIYSITAGLHDVKVQNIEPRNSTTGDCGICFLVLPAGTGIMSRIYFDSLDINDCGGKPIFIKNIDTFEITNCNITSGTLGGIIVFGTVQYPACNGMISYNHIDGRHVASNDGIGIHENDGDLAHTGNNFLVSHNVIHGFAEQAIDINCGDYVTVSDNECYDNVDDGIIATGFHQVFERNKCYQNGRYGIVINCTTANPGGDVRISDNNCYGNGRVDYLLNNVPGYRFYNNIGTFSINGGWPNAN